ncbi:MAG: hypothetical protein ACHQNT_08910 [Bacteroidia bacterium]
MIKISKIFNVDYLLAADNEEGIKEIKKEGLHKSIHFSPAQYPHSFSFYQTLFTMIIGFLFSPSPFTCSPTLFYYP